MSVDRATANRIASKQTNALSGMIRAKCKADAKRVAASEDRSAALSLLMELREGDRRNRAPWRSIRVRLEKRPAPGIEQKVHTVRHRPAQSGRSSGVNLLPRYSGPIVDRMGRSGIFFRSSYYGGSTKPGVGRRATKYILEGALETKDDRVFFECNVADTPEEAMAALELIELINREAQVNGKALFHIIANVPYQFEQMDDGAERMFEIVKRFAEHQFGSRNLPYAIALHPPSEEGDQRNWHVHLIASTRPMVRTAPYQWDIGEMLRREIDNPAAFAEMRQLYAAVQTEVARESGLNITYTALSNVARGLPNAPQQHLGGKRTARVRAGERDSVNERNFEIQLVGEAALIDEKMRHAEQAVAAEAALVGRIQGRFAPSLPLLTERTTPAVSQPIVRAATLPHVPQSSAISVGGARATEPLVALPVANLKSSVQPWAPMPMLSSLSSRPAIGSPPPMSLASPRAILDRPSTVSRLSAITVSAAPPSPLALSASPSIPLKIVPPQRLAMQAATVSTPITLPLAVPKTVPNMAVPASLSAWRHSYATILDSGIMLALRTTSGARRAAVSVPLPAAHTMHVDPVSQRLAADLRAFALFAEQRNAAMVTKEKKAKGAAERATEAAANTLPVDGVAEVAELPRPEPVALTEDAMALHTAQRRAAWMRGWNGHRRSDRPIERDEAPQLRGPKVDDTLPVSRTPRPDPGRDSPSR